MSFGNKLIKWYFDMAYTPLYDLTTARFNAYHDLQKRSIGKFEFEKGDLVLCVGVGTGNEIPCILDGNREIEIVGVDISERALRRAYEKGLKRGKEIKVSTMDVQNLEYSAENFNKVLCLHVMDFVGDDRRATAEILRVLKKGGQFVITYPSNKEGINLAINLLKDGVRHNINSGKFIRVLRQLFVQMLGGIVYPPLILLRPKKKYYSRHELDAMFTELTSGDFHIEEYPVYQDFMVYGKK